MDKIIKYIENNILEKLWKPLPKWLKVCFAIILIMILIVIFVPFLFPKYDEWKTNIENRFGCEKQVPSETTIYIDSTQRDTIKQGGLQPPIIIEDTLRPQKVKTEEIIGKGIVEDFTEEEAQKQALEEAKIDLFSKFPKDKEQIVNRYYKITKNTTEKTNTGMWKAHIIISINESQIK